MYEEIKLLCGSTSHGLIQVSAIDRKRTKKNISLFLISKITVTESENKNRGCSNLFKPSGKL